MSLEIISEQRCFGGTQGFYSHASEATGTPMRFALFPPPAARAPPRAGALLPGGAHLHRGDRHHQGRRSAHAARLGLALVMPDTSPRGAGIEGEDDDWDFGTGAGFYLDADARALVRSLQHVPLRDRRAARRWWSRASPWTTSAPGIFGHSMGGHGALTIALKNPYHYASVSAFAPICAPTRCPWGEKAFTGYLGEDRDAWKAYDACELVADRTIDAHILIDQGQDDQFLAEQLHPHLFQDACRGLGAGADAAHAGRLRPQLLLHRIVHGRPHRAPRRGPGRQRLRRFGRAGVQHARRYEPPETPVNHGASVIARPFRERALRRSDVRTNGAGERPTPASRLRWPATSMVFPGRREPW